MADVQFTAVLARDGTMRLLFVEGDSPRVTGFESAELCAREGGFISLMEPLEARRFRDGLRRLPEEGRVILDCRITVRTGETRWIRVYMNTLGDTDSDGSVTVAGGVQDVTESKAAEAELREREARYRLLADNATDMISRHDPEGFYTYVSPACRQILGYEPEEIIGTSAYDHFHPEGCGAIRKLHDTIVEKPFFSKTAYRIRKKDGRYIWLETTSKVVTDPDSSKVQEIVAISRDVTKRKHIEDERDRLFNYSTDMLCIACIDGFFRQLNPAWTRTLGWSEEELLSRPWIDFVHPEDIPATRVIGEKLELGENIIAFENRYMHKNGGYVWMS